MLNESILNELKKYVPRPGMAELYKMVILDIYKTHRGSVQDERKDISDQIALLNSKLANAREMLFDGKLEADDFTLMKKESENKIKRLEIELDGMKSQKSNQVSLDKMLLKAIEALSHMTRMYIDGDVVRKKEIIGSIFRSKLRFDGNEYRTARLNEAAVLIFQISSELGYKKNGTNRKNLRLSRQVQVK